MTHRMTTAELAKLRHQGKKPRVDREGPIHRAILDHLRIVLPPQTVIHHSPNAIGLSGQQIMRQIAHNKAMGTVKGFPDLLCILPGPRVWLFEVKAPGNSADRDQRKLHADLRALGARVAVVKTTAEVDAAITEWNAAEPARWRMNSYRDLRDRIVKEGTA